MVANGVKKIVIAITGASGIIYGLRTVKALMEAGAEIYLCCSASGMTVMMHEYGWGGKTGVDEFILSSCNVIHPESSLNMINENDFFSPPASGSFIHSGMAIVPCSMNTMGAIASGISGNLIQRAADVCLKERRPLIMVTRETPLNLIHIENMRTLSLAGAVIMPASPSFYGFPASVDDLVDTVVARILDQLGVTNKLAARWGQQNG